MDQVWGISATEWSAIGALATGTSTLAAVAIAVLVHRASSRSTAASRRMVASVEELTRRSRRDDVLRQLRALDDPEHLALLIEEGRVLARGHLEERGALEKAYVSNPASPLLRQRRDVPDELTGSARRDLLNAAIESLPARFPAEHPRYLVRDLTLLIRLARDVGADADKIASFVVGRARTGWDLTADDVRELIAPRAFGLASNVEAGSDLLDEVARGALPAAPLMNILAGVSFGLVDLHGTAGGSGPDPKALASYVSALRRRDLRCVVADRDESGMTYTVDLAVAVMVHAIGVVAVAGARDTERAVESIGPVLDSFPSGRFTPVGRVAEHLRSGVRLLVEKLPPGPLAVDMRGAAARLVPDTAELL